MPFFSHDTMVLAPMIHDLTIIGSVNICDEQTLNFPFGIVPDVNCLENSQFLLAGKYAFLP